MQFSLPRMTSVVKMLLIANAAVFVINAVAQGKLADLFGLSRDGIGDLFGLGALRVFSYQFIHSFTDAFHILMNMLVLFFMGTLVESQIGPRRLLRLYIVSGIAGGVGFLLMGLARGTPGHIPLVGASGAVYGVMVYAACMAPRMRVLFLVFPIELRWLVGFLVAIGVYYTYVGFVTGAQSQVSHAAHLGGAAWGFLAYRLPAREWGFGDRVARWRAERAAQADDDRQRRLDELLEKVHREGITSLTTAERRFLDRASQQMRR